MATKYSDIPHILTHYNLKLFPNLTVLCNTASTLAQCSAQYSGTSLLQSHSTVQFPFVHTVQVGTLPWFHSTVQQLFHSHTVQWKISSTLTV